MSDNANNPLGWDAQAVAEIARRKWGDFEKMFEAHDRPERGSDMMRKVQTRVKETYGSVETFVEKHRDD